MSVNFWKAIVGILVLFNIVIWTAVTSQKDDRLHVIACDVGQGDAILITYKSVQILTDGGPDSSVLKCLSKYIPFYDRDIEVVILTHPQSDHYGGLIEVFKRYNVKKLVANPVDSGTDSYKLLKELVGGEGSEVILPGKGLKIRYSLLYLDVLNPSDRLFREDNAPKDESKLGSYSTKRDLNDYSVVYNLSFGEFDGIFTGDIGPEIEKEIVTSGSLLDVDYIKVPHHGSRNGLTSSLLEFTKPEIAVISAGKNNRYGHPHKEILELLTEKNIKVLGTYDKGDIEVITDGKSWWIAN